MNSPHLDLGNNLEAVVLRLLALRTGRLVEAAERFKLVRNPDNPWCFCTPDGWECEVDTTSDDELVLQNRGIVQAKTAFSMNRHDWEPEPPDHYRVQLQHEMLASDCSWGTLAVLFIDQGVLTRIVNEAVTWEWRHDSQSIYAALADAINDHCDFRLFDYEADRDFQVDLLAAEKAFLNLVDAGVAPSTDGSESCRRAIQRLHPKDNGTEVVLSEDFAAMSRLLNDAKEIIKEETKKKDEIENRIKAAIGDATYGVLPDGSRWAWRTQSRKEFTVAASEIRVLRKEKKKA